MDQGKPGNASMSSEQRDKMLKVAAVGGATIVLAILGYFLSTGMAFVQAFTNVAPLVMVFVVLLVVLRKSPSTQLRWAAYGAGVVFLAALILAYGTGR
jgi:uncharacterized membrane protein